MQFLSQCVVVRSRDFPYHNSQDCSKPEIGLTMLATYFTIMSSNFTPSKVFFAIPEHASKHMRLRLV